MPKKPAKVVSKPRIPSLNKMLIDLARTGGPHTPKEDKRRKNKESKDLDDQLKEIK